MNALNGEKCKKVSSVTSNKHRQCGEVSPPLVFFLSLTTPPCTGWHSTGGTHMMAFPFKPDIWEMMHTHAQVRPLLSFFDSLILTLITSEAWTERSANARTHTKTTSWATTSTHQCGAYLPCNVCCFAPPFIFLFSPSYHPSKAWTKCSDMCKDNTVVTIVGKQGQSCELCLSCDSVWIRHGLDL